MYTPPDFILLPKGVNHKSLYISANETNIPRVKIDLYHTPVVLVHGVWTNSPHSWESTGFYTTLTKNGYDVSFADYGAYNATTFDPYANNSNGNYGIKAINDKIGSILRDYHNHKLIAAAQVDIIAHNMGGLMARGFLQQGHYKNISNYMDGYINHLVTIGTPHFGAHLAGLLYNYRNTEYCYGLATATIIFKNPFCESDKVNYQVLKLKDIF